MAGEQVAADVQASGSSLLVSSPAAQLAVPASISTCCNAAHSFEEQRTDAAKLKEQLALLSNMPDEPH